MTGDPQADPHVEAGGSDGNGSTEAVIQLAINEWNATEGRSGEPSLARYIYTKLRAHHA